MKDRIWDDFDVLREKLRAVLTGGTDYNPKEPDIAARIRQINVTAEGYWRAMNKEAERAFLWEDLNDNSSSAQLSLNYSRLEVMALAYSTKGSELENNQVLRNDLIAALDWMYLNRYHEEKEEAGNWFDWEVATPLFLDNIMVMLYRDLTKEQIANYTRAIEKFSPVVDKRSSACNSDKTDIFMGANRVWKCIAVGLRGIIVKDSAKIKAASDGLSIVFDYVTSGNGFYPDGSFLQHHKHPYTGGYGKALLENLANMLYLLNASPWEVKDQKYRNVFRWVYQSFEPLIYKGAMMDMVRGREIARENFQDHIVGHQVVRAIARLSQFAPAEDASLFKSMVKYWISADTYKNFFEDAPVAMILLGKTILEDSEVQPRGELIFHKQYPYMNRVVHHRPGFAFAISMSSNRTYNFESIMGENLKGWYQGDGMTFLYTDDLSQYSDNFWPTVNPYRLPGTTVDTRARADQEGTRYESPAYWCGGVVLNDRYGCAGMELIAFGSSLRAKKSWYMFDDEIIALGSGISTSDNRVIETIIDNRKITDNSLTVNGATKPDFIDGAEAMDGVRWIHLEDVGGYYFPEPLTVHGLYEARTGRWQDISNYPKFNSTNVYTRRYLTLWLDHGCNPDQATYAYVLLPKKSPEQILRYAEDPDIEILENSPTAQGVREKHLNITAVNFWEDRIKTVGLITCDRKAAVMVREADGELNICLSDPTHLNEGKINLQIARPASDVIRIEPEVLIEQLQPVIRLSFHVQKLSGKTLNVSLRSG